MDIAMDESVAPKDSVEQAIIALRAMADRLEKNADASFGGTCVIVPPKLPDGQTELAPITVAIFESTDLAQFLVMVKSKVEMAIAEATSTQTGYMRR